MVPETVYFNLRKYIVDKLKALFYKLPLAVQAGALIVALVITFGLVGPSLISSNSTIAVWLGIAIYIAVIYLVAIFSGKIRELFQ
jgi:hypothetical protein